MTEELTGTYRGIPYNRDKLGWLGASITHENVKNLIDLADILRKIPPPNFNMEDYGRAQRANILINKGMDYDPWRPMLFYNLGQNLELAVECGTVCCAVGTAAFYGIGGMHEDERWVDYSARVFSIHGNTWKWCFGGEWCTVDNEADGAAARILYMLVHGLDDIIAKMPLNDDDDIDVDYDEPPMYNKSSVDTYDVMKVINILPK